MWEVGYAMALRKPTIIITQEQGELPFDIQDMETLRYDRNHLSQTLGDPLKLMTIDTVSSILSTHKPSDNSIQSAHNELVGELLEHIRELRSMVSQAVKIWNPASQQADEQVVSASDNFATLEGAWVNRVSRTHLYARVINGELIVPYCYGGNNELTSVYYGWKKMGDFWFSRYCWLKRAISGFAFLKQESSDVLTGAWWSDAESREIPEVPNIGSGVTVRWERKQDAQIPRWATRFYEEVRRDGIVNRLTRRSS
jgi:hypothetical protein